MSAGTKRGRLLVISGPSGAGKTTIKKRLAEHAGITVAITVTTRAPRAGEQNDRDYHFVDRETFLRMKEQGQFAETNDVFKTGHLYGSLKAELEAALLERPDGVYLMEVDMIGAHNLKQSGYAGTYVFIAPPDMAVLERRLRERGTDDPAAIERRLARAREEMELARADRIEVIVNTSVDEAVARVLQLVGLSSAAPQGAPAGGAPAPSSPGRKAPSDTLGKQELS